jgi:type I restriction enzyme R subunit
MPLIQAIQSEEWWQDVTTPMLDSVRRRLRLLVRLIDKRQRVILYTDFEDDLGAPEDVTLPEFTTANDWEKFRAKVRAFLLSHQDVTAIQKLRRNEPLTAGDLVELERILTESGSARPEDLQRARTESESLGLFLRSIVGLDREAAKDAFSEFLTSEVLSGNQIEFLNMIIDHLADHGLMDPETLYSSPFTDVTPMGPEGLFEPEELDRLIDILRQVRSTAIATAA